MKILMYENGNKKVYSAVKDSNEGISKIKSYYQNRNMSFEERAKAFSIRLYLVNITNYAKNTNVVIHSLSNKGKLQNKEKAVVWDFQASHQNQDIHIQLIDKMDIVYAIWDMFEEVSQMEIMKIIKQLKNG